jgi:hypothetical protein
VKVKDSFDLSFFKIPLQGVYVYPKGKARATFSGGINMYGLIYPIPAYSAGLLYHVNKKLSLSVQAELETLPLGGEDFNTFVLPSWNVIDVTFSAGVRYTF